MDEKENHDDFEGKWYDSIAFTLIGFGICLFLFLTGVGFCVYLSDFGK